MIEFKKRTFFLSSGKQIKLIGNCLAINSCLQMGQGYALDILSWRLASNDQQESVVNPYSLTPQEIDELADFNIHLWQQLKEKIKQYGLRSTKIFNK